MADKEVIGVINQYRVNLLAKDINKSLTGPRFVDKSIDEYIYASLTQPPIKIIDKRGSNDELDYIVECPNCGSHICYGTDTYMYAGHIYCSNEGCREEVVDKYESIKRGNKTN